MNSRTAAKLPAFNGPAHYGPKQRRAYRELRAAFPGVECVFGVWCSPRGEEIAKRAAEIEAMSPAWGVGV